MNQTTLAATPSCTPPCWKAKQKTCVCSCRGLNHGTLRPANPTPPPDPDANPDLPFQFVAFLEDIQPAPPAAATVLHKKRTRSPSTPHGPASMHRHLVTVSPDHLHHGVPCDMRACSLALAITNCSRQATPLFNKVLVALKATTVNDTLLTHSQGVQAWIADHDDPATPLPNPATFVIDLQNATLSLREENQS